jgi:pyruvate/2-oxoglutarate dehydrogenase complex dihydrolipoamide dehydrogenase (E3) component
MGIDVRFGAAHFADPHTVEIEGEDGIARFTARYIAIGAGASAFVPPIEGLRDVPYLTNETLFEITEQPRRLAIVGGRRLPMCSRGCSGCSRGCRWPPSPSGRSSSR